MDIKLALHVASKNWNDLEWWKGTAVPFAKRTVLSGTLKPYYRLFGPSGEDFTDADWDNLLILDACRFDMFEEACDIDGELTTKTSVGASTPEFLKNTFRGESFPEIVYVTANPQVNLRLDTSIFHDVINVWETDWNEELGTVEPEYVTQAALEAQERYPNKRLVVHYMQPHYPFIGEKTKDRIDEHAGFELSKRLADDEGADRDVDTIWDQLKNGEVEESAVWEAYRENLRLVLDDIVASLDEFRGKSVITADHGNLVGESVTPLNLELYGHPTGIHAEDLVTVPWLTVENGERKVIQSDTTAAEDVDQSLTEEDTEQIKDRLEDLGYA